MLFPTLFKLLKLFENGDLEKYSTYKPYVKPEIKPPEKAKTIFGPDFEKSIKKHDKIKSLIAKKIKEFIALKTTTPNVKFTADDYMLSDLLAGYGHAHLTADISVIYKIENKILLLYGIYTHDELRTGSPPSTNRQKSMAARFKNAF